MSTISLGTELKIKKLFSMASFHFSLLAEFHGPIRFLHYTSIFITSLLSYFWLHNNDNLLQMSNQKEIYI